MSTPNPRTTDEPSSAGQILRIGIRTLTPRSFRGKIVASTVLLMTAVIVGVGVGVQLLLSYTAQRDIDSVLQERASAVVAAIDASSADSSTLQVPEAVVEPGVVVYDENGNPVAGTIEHEVREAADDLATTTTARNVDASEEVRLRAVPFSTSGGHHGVVVVSQETTPYERSEMYALVATIGIGIVVIVITAGIANRVTSQTLAPVTQMAERATDWSEHDLSQRFELGEADKELAQLGATLDGLLDRVAMAIRAEQRLTSELAHELRTPLTAIQGSADLALLRGVDDPVLRAELDQIATSARAMSEVITTLVDVARDRAGAGVASTCHASDVVADVHGMVPPSVTFIDKTGGSTARIAGPPELVVRALAPLVDNAVAHANSTVRLVAVDTASSVELSVSDDGPGIGSQVRETLFTVGASGNGGTGLGLGIAQRIAKSMGGDIRADQSQSGATFTLTLPRA